MNKTTTFIVLFKPSAKWNFMNQGKQKIKFVVSEEAGGMPKCEKLIAPVRVFTNRKTIKIILTVN